MQDQRDHRDQEEQVNEATRDMKHGEATDPRYQENHERDHPDAHFSSPITGSPIVACVTLSGTAAMRRDQAVFDACSISTYFARSWTPGSEQPSAVHHHACLAVPVLCPSYRSLRVVKCRNAALGSREEPHFGDLLVL
jgi:hypothetical protein